MITLIEGMADYIAQGVEGLSYEDLADDNEDLKTKHRLGRLTDINQLTKSEARAIARCCKRLVLEDLADPQNITPKMVEAAHVSLWNGEGTPEGRGRKVYIVPRAIIKAAISAALTAAKEK